MADLWPPGLWQVGFPFCTKLDALLAYPGCTSHSAEYTKEILGSPVPLRECTMPPAKRPVVVVLEPLPAHSDDGRRVTELVLAVRGTSERQSLCRSDDSPWEFKTKVVVPTERAVYQCRLASGTRQGCVTVESGMLALRSWSAGAGASVALRGEAPDASAPIDPLGGQHPHENLSGRSLALPCGATVEFRAKSAAAPPMP